MNKPSSDLMQAVELYHAILHAVALIGMYPENTLKTVRDWIPGSGMDQAEMQSVYTLIDNGLEP